MKYLVLTLFAANFLACSQPTQHAEASQKNPGQISFKFSTAPYVMDMRDPTNWCAARFGGAVLIGAAPDNYNRRLFALGDAPLRIVVDFGKMAATFMLRKAGAGVEIYTSDNFPSCLSNKANFQIAPDGTSFRYDNKREIKFDALIQELPNGLQIAIDLPPNGGYGIAAVGCESCK